MIRQIRYFQSVVRNNSFSEAAEECHISQSAISQQIKALENELGFSLLERYNRKFALTPAGEYFYKKSLVLITDYEQMCREAAKLAHGDETVLKIGYLRSHRSPELYQALEEFSIQYPSVDLQLLCGNHEELFDLLRTGGADLVFNDQRRAFSNEYVNMILTTNRMYIELAARNPAAELSSVTVQELKNIPCILVASREQQTNEKEFYKTIIGIQGEILYADNLEEAYMMVVSGKGFLPVEGSAPDRTFGAAIRRIPLYHGENQIACNYCLFWKKNNSGYYVEEFADIMKTKFE